MDAVSCKHTERLVQVFAIPRSRVRESVGVSIDYGHDVLKPFT